MGELFQFSVGGFFEADQQVFAGIEHRALDHGRGFGHQGQRLFFVDVGALFFASLSALTWQAKTPALREILTAKTLASHDSHLAQPPP